MYDTASMRRNFSIRAVVAGMLIGIFVNLSNTYYGLIAGSSQQMPIVFALLGYLIFKLFTKAGFHPLSKAENVLIVSTATATGCMPVTAGVAELFPAIEYILEPADGGPLHLSWASMIVWSLGLCFFGIIFAALLRERLVTPQDMPWPGATASSNVIKSLHIRAQEPSDTYDYAEPVAVEESYRGLSIIFKSAGVSMLIVSVGQIYADCADIQPDFRHVLHPNITRYTRIWARRSSAVALVLHNISRVFW